MVERTYSSQDLAYGRRSVHSFIHFSFIHSTNIQQEPVMCQVLFEAPRIVESNITKFPAPYRACILVRGRDNIHDK